MDLPKSKHLTGKALYKLFQGRRINTPVFFDETGSYSLSNTVSRLRRRGWPIDGDMEPFRTGCGRVAAFKKYYISQENLSLIRDQYDLSTFISSVKEAAKQ